MEPCATHIRSQSGQAVVEYLLILTVTMMLVLGGMYQFSTAFRAFAQSYFGNYLECLLETGELPSVGAGDGICASSYEPFSFARGRPLMDTSNLAGGPGGSGPGAGGNGGGFGGGSGGGGSGFGSDGSGSGGGGRSGGGPGFGRSGRIAATGTGDSGASESSGSDSAGGASGSVGGSGIGGGSRFQAASARANNASAASQSSGDAISLSAGEAAAMEMRANGRAFRRLGGSAQDEAIGRRRFVPSNERPRESESVDRVTVTASDTRSRRGGRVLASDRRSGDVQDSEEAELGLGLPDFMRYLLIAGILAVVVVFFGGQLAAFRKSYEKGSG